MRGRIDTITRQQLPPISTRLDQLNARAGANYSMETSFPEAVKGAQSWTDEAKKELIILEKRPEFLDWLFAKAQKAKQKRNEYYCPCCSRAMNDDEFQMFEATKDRLLEGKWRQRVEACREEVLSRQTLADELGAFLPVWQELNKTTRTVTTVEERAQVLNDEQSKQKSPMQQQTIFLMWMEKFITGLLQRLRRER